ncbi:hypothetical protein LCGC14_1293200 [marine sediment metagenome]|uniref:Uncharacterized protein n=1 Tax=marine sediment metagenome TaxID=412755 RepID=A0A0F9NUQ0_9ZZZZ
MKKNKTFIDKKGHKVHEVQNPEEDMKEIYNTCKIRATEGIRSWRYDILHELAHGVSGESCCREHCEFEAHGGATMLAFILGVDIGDADERMIGYAGISSHKACGRVEAKREYDKQRRKDGTRK